MTVNTNGRRQNEINRFTSKCPYSLVGVHIVMHTTGITQSHFHTDTATMNRTKDLLRTYVIQTNRVTSVTCVNYTLRY